MNLHPFNFSLRPKIPPLIPSDVLPHGPLMLSRWKPIVVGSLLKRRRPLTYQIRVVGFPIFEVETHCGGFPWWVSTWTTLTVHLASFLGSYKWLCSDKF